MSKLDQSFSRHNFEGSRFVFTQFKNNPALSVAGLPLLALDAVLLPVRALLRSKKCDDDSDSLHGWREIDGEISKESYRAPPMKAETQPKPKRPKSKKKSEMYDGWRWPPSKLIPTGVNDSSEDSRHQSMSMQKPKTGDEAKADDDYSRYSYFDTSSSTTSKDDASLPSRHHETYSPYSYPDISRSLPSRPTRQPQPFSKHDKWD